MKRATLLPRYPDPAALAKRIAAGEPLALARGISLVENESAGFERLLHELEERMGTARRIGITGPPGAGKSTLTAVLIRRYLDRSLTVGVIAVDPTSPFTGGALLGDRIRMNELATEQGIFIRSMASRGSLGGLATATREAADLMDAAGFDIVILETLGVGQSELDIAASADSTVVVLVPESGDGIQAMKAGLMEVADLFVINKADRPGADRLEKEIRIMMSIRAGNALQDIVSHHGAALSPSKDAGHGSSPEMPASPSGAAATETASPWKVPVVQTVASTGEGVESLAERLDRHFDWLEAAEELGPRRAERRLSRARAALLRRAGRDAERVWREQGPAGLDGRSPYEVARRLYEQLRRERQEE